MKSFYIINKLSFRPRDNRMVLVLREAYKRQDKYRRIFANGGNEREKKNL